MKPSTIKILRKYDLLLIIGTILLMAPFVTVQRMTDFIIFSIFVLAYDLLYGYMGRLSFGHMLYFGVGAYATALTTEHLTGNPFLAILVALIAGGTVGLILGPIIVRTTGACFALINLAFNQLGFFIALTGLAEWTGGEDGMASVFDKVWLLNFNNRFVVFGFSLISLILTVFFVRRLTDSPFGLLLRTIKENETRAKFLGYNTYIYKLTAFAISTSLAAFAGSLSILNYTYVTTSFIDTTRNVEVIFASLIGGAGSVYGAIIGGFGYMTIANYLPKYIQRWEMFLGFALLLQILFFREGIWGYLTKVFNQTKPEGKDS